ncbi:unnamed protein product [Ectocarpus fasciculatus]
MDVDAEGAATLSSKIKTELGEEGGPTAGGRGADAADAKAGKTENSSAGKGAASGGRERAKSPACGVGRAEDEEASASASVHAARPTTAAPRRGDGATGEEREYSDRLSVLAAALLLVRHAMQDTFGKGAVTVTSKNKKPAPPRCRRRPRPGSRLRPTSRYRRK